MRLQLLTFSFFVAAFAGQAQNPWCGTDIMVEKAIASEPKLAENRSLLQIETEAFEANRTVVNHKVVPVVFHIIHDYGESNISKEQVEDAVRILNEDFSMSNPDASDVIPVFQGIMADCDIEFRLAQIDPLGNCTEGITRSHSLLTYSAGENVKDLAFWGADMYLNVWVVENIEGNAAGYAYYPGTAPSGREGILVQNSYFGSIGESSPNSSRTLSHEVGHYLNLAHVWGSTNSVGEEEACNYDDWVSDTPATVGTQFICDLGQWTCGSLDNVQNHMDYSACERMFTEGQKTRMHAALTSTIGGRWYMWQASNLWATGVHNDYGAVACAPIADFSSDISSGCAGVSVAFQNQTFNTDIGSCSYFWEFANGTPSSSTEVAPVVAYNTPGQHDVSLTVTNSQGQNTTTHQNELEVLNTTGGEIAPFSEGFESYSFPINTADLNKNWTVESPNYSASWDQQNVAAASGNGSVRIRSQYLSSQAEKHSLRSPTVDFSSLAAGESTNLSFMVAYARKSNLTDDQLKVYASIDCGATWTLRYSRNTLFLISNDFSYVSGNFVPSENEWAQHTVNMDDYAGEPHVLLRFQFNGQAGSWLYVDDLSISGAIGLEEDPFETTLFPNPSAGNASLTFTAKGKINLTVCNAIGQKIYREALQANGAREIALPQLASGLYFVTLKGEQHQTCRKLIITE